MFQERYKKLNKEQGLAVDTIEGPTLVVAGPGSGKTEILGLRVANILRKTDAHPADILCITFSDSAAVNLRKRLLGLIGHDAHKVSVHTFHDFGVSIRNDYPEFFYGGRLLSPTDEVLQREIVEEVLDGLPHKDPLSSKSEELGYVFLSNIKNAISYLKKAGIDPHEFENVLAHNEKFIDFANPFIDSVFGPRISKKTIKLADELLLKLRSFDDGDFPLSGMPSLKKAVTSSLESALADSLEQGKPTPLSRWKSANLKRDENKKRVLKEDVYLEKMRSLAGIYNSYQEKMRQKGYYDFDDMIMDAIHEVGRNDVLRAELQERYRYILVDEFQDTNDAQMRLLYLITDSPVNEGRPNIMAVGDDDQAIYKFQGAEISNITNFKDRFPETKLIVLTKNYRSHKNILDFAGKLIRKGEDRLENVVPEIKKDLVQADKDLKKGEVKIKSFATGDHEHFFVASEIEKKIKSGEKPSNIAVIARNHKTLKEIASFFNLKKIPYRYKRRDNVLDQVHIRQLLKMMEFVFSLSGGEGEEADWLLPDILRFPFWDIERKLVWEVSVKSRRSGKPWLGVMLESGNKKIKAVAEFFVEVSGDAASEPFEYIIDKLVGTRTVNCDRMPESPFKEFYFSDKNFENKRSEYLVFLSNLKFFMEAVREHKRSSFLSLGDVINFVKFHEDNNIPISDTSPFIGAEDSVELITAHDAKGREFESVFLLGAVSDVWARNRSRSSLPMPANLPIAPAGDNTDDKLRLFFVAVTRAKTELVITSHRTKRTGKETVPLEFIEEEPVKVEESEVGSGEVVGSLWEARTAPPFVVGEEEYLKNIVDDYQMSVTHLNNFLDVAGGGPRKFLENNLLRFPQAKTSGLSFGTAMHATIEWMHNKLKDSGRLPDVQGLADYFRETLKKERLSAVDYGKLEKRGVESLRVYYEKKQDEISVRDLVEVNFKNEGVVLAGARLGGKIDKISFTEDDKIIVRDFKTGKAEKDWKGGSLYSKIKLHKYRQQLAFYKLLVENSNKFKGKKVSSGVLEFLEPVGGEILELSLEMDDDLLERTEKLIGAVYKKIKNLEFPDVSDYPENVKGIKQFEEDLLAE